MPRSQEQKWFACEIKEHGTLRLYKLQKKDKAGLENCTPCTEQTEQTSPRLIMPRSATHLPFITQKKKTATNKFNTHSAITQS
jgi:transcription elongation factor Elf1